MAHKIKRIRDVMRPTTDTWYPNYPGNLVKVTVTRLSDGKWRVCVWGADDDGMERDLHLQEEALALFEALPKVITKADLTARGFIRA